MIPEPIGPQTILSSLFKEHPQTIQYFIQHRMKCVGCCISSFDTIADAAVNYDVPLSKLVNELEFIVSDLDETKNISNP